MRFVPAARRVAAVLAACVAASGVAGIANASPTVSDSASASSAPRTSAAASGGMYGELSGSPSRTVPRAVIEPTKQASQASGGSTDNWDDKDGGTVCGVYANSSGMGSYCSSGQGGGALEPLIERFPGMEFENCRYENPPPGVKVPWNPSPDEKKWQLRTCLTAINWFTWDGGDGRRIIMDLVLVDKDMDTTYVENDLEEFLWDSRQTTYPVPMLRAEPKTYPVVGQQTYFTFSWLNAKSGRPVSEGPYEDAERGGPYVEHHNRGMEMRARATEMTIDPQIEGRKPFECTVPKLGYDEDKEPLPTEQPSDCHFVFHRSSAAAEDISTAEKHLDGSTDVFRMQLDITWEVEYGTNGDMTPLGNGYHMRLFQDLPVLESQGINVVPPEMDIG